jgi:hypothetical protein
MKKVYDVMIKSLLILFFISSGQLFGQTNALLQEIISKVSTDSLVKTVSELSGKTPIILNGVPDTILTRHFNRAGNAKARIYLSERLTYCNVDIEIDTFSTPLSADGENIIAELPGTLYPNQKVIVCAHYDDEPHLFLAPGADDNAAGVAVVLEAARILSQYQFPYTILFVLWDEEEHGLLGSGAYASRAAAAGDSIIAVINMDVIAYDSNDDWKAEVHVRDYGNSIAQGVKFRQLNQDLNIGLNLRVVNPGRAASDHASFWNNNYPAIYVRQSQDDFNPNYHTIHDVIDSINIPYFVKMAKAVITATAYFASDPFVPVELASFYATTARNAITLNWETVTELNNSGFELYRSSERGSYEDWSMLSFIPGNGTTTEIVNYSYTDKGLLRGSYKYKLIQVDFDGSRTEGDILTVSFDDSNLDYSLEQNYPNPFNPSTKIAFSIPEAEEVTISLYSTLGEKIRDIYKGERDAGNHEIDFHAGDLTSGIYYYKMKTGNYTATKKLVIMK